MVAGIEPVQDLVQDGLVLDQQPALHPPLGRAAERVEGGAAQPLEAGQQAEGAQHPGAVAPFLQMAGDGIPVGQQRRRQMDLEAVPALELGAELVQERAVGPEPGDLVLVLDRHQLEQVAGHGLAEAVPTGRAPRLGLAHPCDDLAVAARIGRVLVGGEEGARCSTMSSSVCGWRACRHAGHGLDRGQIVRGAAAPQEGLPVEGDLDAVDLDRPLDRLAGERDQPALPSEPDQEQVGADGVADERGWRAGRRR